MKTLYTGIFSLLVILCFAQNSKIDSLKLVLKNYDAQKPELRKNLLPDKSDTTKVNILIGLSWELRKVSEYAAAIKYADEALSIARLINYKIGIANSYSTFGNIYYTQGDFKEALKYYFATLKIREETVDKKNIAATYNNIGLVYEAQGNYSEALKSYLAYFKMCEETGNKKGIANVSNNIGNIYIKIGNYPEALKNYFVSLKKREEIGDKHGIAMSYNNIGSTYFEQGNYQEALKNDFASLKIKEEIGDKYGMAMSYYNIGDNYYKQSNYPKALKNQFAALKISKEIGDKEGIALSYNSIGRIKLKVKAVKEGKDWLTKGLKLAEKMEALPILKASYEGLAIADSALGNFKGAYENHKLFILYRDSLNYEESARKTTQMLMQYEFDKKEAKTKAEQDKKDSIAKEELKHKEQQRNYFIIGFALLSLLTIFIFRGYRQKQRANIIIAEKNKEITDSITYALRIQQAKLPKKVEIYSAFPNCFVLFKPKDIVSGDFYYFQKNEKSIFIATADCTGHGVPGAFMSMIGSEKLDDALAHSTNTSEILSILNKGIKSSLKQSESDGSATRDGMDIALCSVDTDACIVKYAGANRPLWIIRNGHTTVEEIKATKKGIGGFTEDNQYFDTHEIKLQQGDTFYICTDGYGDQFNGKNGKKLMTKKFKEILLSIQNKTMQEQEKHLDNFLENWKAGTEQVDDILVIGVRL